MNLTHLTATQLLEHLQSKAITPEEIVQSCLRRIREIDPTVHAWECIDEEVIQAQLTKIGTYTQTDYPLYAIPIGVKDIYNTYDMPTQMGSPIWKDFTPGNDARM
ncbi:MAG: amidase family protein, partial [Epsilonproteobacteria bacterium]|nr:amidase family protein [Campylobacterota bacterium]